MLYPHLIKIVIAVDYLKGMMVLNILLFLLQ